MIGRENMDGRLATDQSGSTAPEVLQTFDYEGVRLLPGPFLSQVDRARDVYGSIPNDDILKGFRSAAGLAAPGAGMSGTGIRVQPRPGCRGSFCAACDMAD